MQKLQTPDEKIRGVIAAIHREFPVQPTIPRSICLAHANGDDWSLQKIIRALDYRPWNELTFEDFSKCGSSELKSHLMPQARVYYLPGLMASVLQDVRKFTQSRLCEVSTLMLLPTPTPEFHSVWEYFGDGLFEGWGTPFFMESTRDLITKNRYCYDALTPAQRECVADYIEIAITSGVEQVDPEFSMQLKKFTDFWRGLMTAPAP